MKAFIVLIFTTLTVMAVTGQDTLPSSVLSELSRLNEQVANLESLISTSGDGIEPVHFPRPLGLEGEALENELSQLRVRLRIEEYTLRRQAIKAQQESNQRAHAERLNQLLQAVEAAERATECSIIFTRAMHVTCSSNSECGLHGYCNSHGRCCGLAGPDQSNETH